MSRTEPADTTDLQINADLRQHLERAPWYALLTQAGRDALRADIMVSVRVALAGRRPQGGGGPVQPVGGGGVKQPV